MAYALSVPLVALLMLSSWGLAQEPAASPSGSGLLDSTLDNYVSAGQLWQARGSWYNILSWAARTSNCANNATSVACMACSMNRPPFAVVADVAPIAVANKLWFAPERGAVCGMCLKVYMPNGTTSAPGCPDAVHRSEYPGCAGDGTEPYFSSVSDPLNYGAKVEFDESEALFYFVAIIVEWNQTDPYALSYPTQKEIGVSQFGSWPVLYEGIPCPVGNSTLGYQFLNAATPVPVLTDNNQTAWLASGTSQGLPPGVGGELCNNLENEPCGPVKQVSQSSLGFVKLQIVGQRVPISRVEIYLADRKWHTLNRSGDNYWQPESSLGFSPNTDDPVDVKIFCADGSPPQIEKGLIPAMMLCSYQDPGCSPYFGAIQC